MIKNRNSSAPENPLHKSQYKIKFPYFSFTLLKIFFDRLTEKLSVKLIIDHYSNFVLKPFF